MNRLDAQVLRETACRLRRNRAEKKRSGLYPLETLILYVTMRCNCKCAHCFLHDALNTGADEMSLDQIERLAESVPPLRQLQLTGGEPTLRRDLPEIIRAFARRGKAALIGVNTNGLNTGEIVALAEAVKGEFPALGLAFQISIDGLEETHDRLRGVPGCFGKAMETLRRLSDMRQRLPGLAAHVLTVISESNYKELVPLNDYLRENVGKDVLQGFELVRNVETTAWNIPRAIKEANTGPKKSVLPPVEAFDRIARDLKKLNRRSANPANAFHVHNLAQLEMVKTGRPQFKCVTAGQAIGVVYSNGGVAHCEFTKPFAKLSEFGWDFQALWRSEAAEQRRRQIGQCYCIHGCFHGTSVEYSWKGLARMFLAGL